MREGTLASILTRAQTVGRERHVAVVRVVAGALLLVIGLAHVFVDTAPMRPLVEEMNFPLPALVSPLAVGLEIVAGLSLILGLFARLGALLAIPVMTGAFYSHLVIDVWPNGAENEPPIFLPVLIALAAAYIVWRGAGRWSLDGR